VRVDDEAAMEAEDEKEADDKSTPHFIAGKTILCLAHH